MDDQDEQSRVLATKRTVRYVLIGLGVVAVVAFGVGVWRQNQHRFHVSCDDRSNADHSANECTDYYGDEGEIMCGLGTMKKTPCDRTGALGGCHKKTKITWHYRGSDPDDKWSGCASGEKTLRADWKEHEE